MFEAANFPQQGRIVDPQAGAYRMEALIHRDHARLLARAMPNAAAEHIAMAERMDSIVRRLSWTPKYLEQIKREAAA